MQLLGTRNDLSLGMPITFAILSAPSATIICSMVRSIAVWCSVPIGTLTIFLLSLPCGEAERSLVGGAGGIGIGLIASARWHYAVWVKDGQCFGSQSSGKFRFNGGSRVHRSWSLTPTSANPLLQYLVIDLQLCLVQYLVIGLQ